MQCSASSDSLKYEETSSALSFGNLIGMTVAACGTALLGGSSTSVTCAGLLPTLSVSDITGWSETIKHNLACLSAHGSLQILAKNASIVGAMIKARDLSLNIEHDLFVSSVLDEVMSDREISGVSMCVLGGANSWLSMFPGLRFGSESRHKKFISQRAGLLGSNSVDVKVGRDFAQISADIECHDADQKNISVGGERKVSELEETDEKKLNVISTEFLSNISGILNDYNQISEVYNSIKTRAINSNKSEKEAEAEAKEVVEEVSEIKEIGAKVEQKTEKAKQVFTEKVKRKIAEKSTVAAVEVTNADDEKLLELANQYLKYEEVRDIIFDYETQLSDAYKGAEAQFASRTWSEKVSDFVTSLQEVYAEECERFKADPAKYIGDVAIDSAYFVGDTFIPGGLQNVAEYCHDRTTLREAIQNESIDLSIDVGLYLCGAKIVKGAGKCLAKPICKLYEKATQKTISRAEKLAEQRKVGNVGTYGELTDGKPFHDGKQAHHMPAQKYLKANNLDKNEGFSIMMTEEQHAKTRTFKRRADKIDLNASYRDELARDLKDVKRILKEEGCWNSDVRQSILKGLDNFRKEYPQLFEKVNK